MMCDVRELPESEILFVTKKIVKSINDVKKSGDKVYFGANVNSFEQSLTNWHSRGSGHRDMFGDIELKFSDLMMSTNISDKPFSKFYIEYYPPRGGRIRFDYHLSAFDLIHTDRKPSDGGSERVLKSDYTLECLALLNNAFIVNKCLGFNSASAFEDLSSYGGPKKQDIFSKILRR